ncbi:hypothetical protein ACRYCC_09835 [Actinomadura scrupuli]|uniref:hypothetical protein n=1 Tax=Actinomadura scrupuli TaxID=559629 RepID=UPI003D993A82
MTSHDVAQAADALLMAITAAQVDESGDAIPYAVAGIYSERIDGLQVETTECAGECPALGRAAQEVGGEFGRIISGQLILQIGLLARLAQELDRPHDEILREILEAVAETE